MERTILPQLFVVCGTLNILVIKWSDGLQGKCSDDKWRNFQHPILQAALMFFGEFLCFALYKILFFFLKRRGDDSENLNLLTRGGREFSPISLLFPALCDTAATIMLFTGLYLTYATSFQMLRAIAIIFIGVFSSIYLNQTLTTRHWIAIFTIICGTIVLISVDVQRVYYDNTSLSIADANAILTGDLMIICAQILHAAQYVYEEKHVKAMDIPALEATGWQGIFGLLITIILSISMNFLPAQIPFGDNSRGVFDDFGDILPQLNSNAWIAVSLSIFIITSAIYNYSALSIVKFSSSTNRILADSLRILPVWLGVLLLEWEKLNFGIIMAFFILTIGTAAYRNAIFVEWYRSLLARLARRRYVDLTVDTESDIRNAAASRPADVI